VTTAVHANAQLRGGPGAGLLLTLDDTDAKQVAVMLSGKGGTVRALYRRTEEMQAGERIYAFVRNIPPTATL
jgi:hypothetical protein